MQLILTILVVVLAIVLIAMISLQSGKNSGLGAISGGSSETFLAKNKAKSLDAKLARYTKYVAGVFVVRVMVLGMI